MIKKVANLVVASLFLCSTALAQDYTVVAGDNLTKIADHFGVTVEEIQQQNNLDSWVLNPGQTITIPSNDNSDTAKKVAFVNADDLNLRDGASLDANVSDVLSSGTSLEVMDYGDTWTKVKNGNEVGYVATRYLSFNQAKASRGSNVQLNRLRQVALSLEGSPYRSGGTTPSGFDCSGFTSYVFGQFGVELPRTSSEQFSVGTSVGRDNLQVGDLIFFDTSFSGRISHVGIYVGNNKMIHAATRDVEVSDLDWYFTHYRYFGAKRVV
jgi:peptidoglycan DL-endopeptidase LytE